MLFGFIWYFMESYLFINLDLFGTSCNLIYSSIEFIQGYLYLLIKLSNDFM
jgi:hypothetical protein